MPHVVAVVGLTGSGKSELAQLLADRGYVRVRFGDATDIELVKRGLPATEANERLVREEIRHTHGMGAYALLNRPRMDELLALKKNVVADGLRSWAEFVLLKEHYGDRMLVVAVHAPPAMRRERLEKRPVRPLTADEVRSRDYAEIEKLDMGGPIAMAELVVVNDAGMEKLEEAVDLIAREMAARG